MELLENIVKKRKISLYERYWIYSDTEAELMQKVNKGVKYGKSKLGTVITENGIIKNYTSMINTPEQAKYSDSVIVMKGDIRKVKFTTPEID